ncbi:MAG: hypothetical protein IPK39_00910 [Sulfuritalea sp.]|nr:hypothetical protein [Sulfuritalea sp.]
MTAHRHHDDRMPGRPLVPLFNNKPLVDALIDRFQHHCITLRIDGPSLRTSAPATKAHDKKAS